MDTTTLLIGAILFLSAFTQGLSGFGVALVSMALLPGIIGIKESIALVALVGITVDFGVLLRYWRSLRFSKVLPLVLASFIGVPVGIFLLRRADEGLALAILGIILVLYALYALSGLALPELKGRIWGYIAGFLGGLLGGSFNTPGPPIILYASCKKWEPDEFKSNLQGFFLQNAIIVVLGHWLSGNFTTNIWGYFGRGLPWLIGGLFLGLSMDRWINPEVFRKIVLVLLVIMGLRLLL
ncbi:MAG: sulfite exporter TauE/SafE family protein [Chloroflexi bacterium]|nr:sulfite exporter TauE/SafE family protein [Chloroflexota bacterium]